MCYRSALVVRRGELVEGVRPGHGDLERSAIAVMRSFIIPLPITISSMMCERAPTSDNTDFCGASPFLRFLNKLCVTCGSTQRTPYQLLRSFLSVGKSYGFDIFG